MTDLPRVLVISHNPFSDLQNNGKTLLGFFEDWPRERLAQLYLTLDEPSFTNCDTFYRVTDLDVLKDLLATGPLRRLPVGLGASQAGPVQETSWSADHEVKSSLGRSRAYRMIRKVFLARPPSAIMLRSFVWSHGRRDQAGFQRWLDDFDPEVVFFQSSSAVFAFDIVEQVCAERGIPLVVETTDDYVTPRSGWSPASRLYYRQMQRVYQRAVDRSHAVVAIGQKMADEYRERFGGRYLVAMNSVDLQETTPPAPLTGDRAMVLLFAGNLGLNRWRVLASVGAALDVLHERHGVEARLDVYSIDTPEPDVLEALTASSRVRFLGGVDAPTLRERRSEADVVVHVESFDARNRHVTRLSVSTKIPEYMASDRTILAVGPGDVASLEYVRDGGFGQVVPSEDPGEIADALHALARDEELRSRLRARGRELVAANHDREATKQAVTDLVLEAVGRGTRESPGA